MSDYTIFSLFILIATSIVTTSHSSFSSKKFSKILERNTGEWIDERPLDIRELKNVKDSLRIGGDVKNLQDLINKLIVLKRM